MVPSCGKDAVPAARVLEVMGAVKGKENCGASRMIVGKIRDLW